jgi:hypothetical protein
MTVEREVKLAVTWAFQLGEPGPSWTVKLPGATSVITIRNAYPGE